MIKKIHACSKMNFSSNINEVIRAVLSSLFLFTKRFSTHKKALKTQKSIKRHKDTRAKAQKRK